MRLSSLAQPLSLLALLLAAGCSGGKGGDSGGPPKVGTHRTFWAWKLSVMPPVDEQVPATCRRVTDHAYLFVADDLAATVTEAQLDGFEAALETQTPAGSIDSASGIIANDVSTFGPIPDELDGDPHVYVLLMNIAGFQGFTFDGFFRALDELTDAEAEVQQGYHSNEVEMLFMNAAIRPVDDVTTESVFAHELVHLIEYGLDQNEEGWMSESFGELGMTINGYYTDESWVADYMAHPDNSLKGSQFTVHYGACLLWSDYLYQRFGKAFITHLASLTSAGMAGVDQALADTGAGTTAAQTYLDWVAANGAHAPGAAGGKWGYTFQDVPLVTPWQTLTAVPSSAGSIAIDAYAARYVKITGQSGTAFTATITSTAAASQSAVVVRYLSTDRNQVDVAFPPLDASNTTVVPIVLTSNYDEALVGLTGSAAGSMGVSIGP